MDKERLIANIERYISLNIEQNGKIQNFDEKYVNSDHRDIPNFKSLRNDIKSILQDSSLVQSSNGRNIDYVGLGFTLTTGVITNILMSVATDLGARESVNWLERALTTKTSGVRITSEIHGLVPPPEGVKINGVTIIPIQNLHDTKTARAMLAAFDPKLIFHGIVSPPISAAIIEIDNFKLTAHDDDSTRYFAPQLAHIARTIAAFTGAGAGAPTISRSWSEYLNDDIERFKVFTTWKKESNDGGRPNNNYNIDSDGIQFVERYFSIKGKLENKLAIASSRLNLARRRVAAGDKAIDGSICLEALLGTDRFDITYKRAYPVKAYTY